MSSNTKWNLFIESVNKIHDNLLKELSPNYIYKNIGAPLIYATYITLKNILTGKLKY